MERPCTQLILFICCGLLFKNVESASPSAMFVFGDSYVDTGNLQKTMAAWRPPYGISFPGKPSGRHSDGKVLTDFIASAFKIPTPVPYNQRNSNPNLLHFGMNFATGGTGVFNTWPGLPNTTTQIDQLQQLIGNGGYPAGKLTASLVLFSVSGNDYGYYLLQQGALEGLLSLVQSVIKQLSADLVRLYNMGFRRFALTNMAPMGCLPALTVQNSYASCNTTLNTFALYHNSLLRQAVQGVRKSRADAAFVLLDQFSDSLAILQRPTHYGKFKEPLKPCCIGQCGVTDQAGKAMYSVCAHRESAFFWDIVHPTQAAWKALMTRFEPSLRRFQT
jgi:phospholipase/lecithinase/hemolysin